MKSIKLLVAAVMLAVGTSASAQFTNTSNGGSSTVANTDGWSTFYVQYNPISLDIDGEEEDFTGFTIGMNKAFSISNSSPLFLETGVGLQYATYDENDLKINLFSAKVPLNFIYNWQLPNSSISIAPYAGAMLRFNISGKAEYDDEDLDLFDEDEMYGDEWKRFQIGWQIGVNARFNDKFLVGVSYGGDFSEIAEETKVKTTSITLGYCF